MGAPMRRVLGILLATALAVLGLAATATPAQAATRHTPVVFVHGFLGDSSNWAAALLAFRTAGYTADELYTYDYNWAGDNIVNARGLGTFVDQVRSRTGHGQVDVVNHSMGGLVTGWYVNELGGQPKVRHVASIAGANHGTTAAYACIAFTSCQQMVPGSAFIRTYTAGDETPGTTRYATWYSPCDGVILPYDSTRLAGATNNFVLCQNHLAFLADPFVLGAVRRFLGT
jgi:triacylglycerol lipase